MKRSVFWSVRPCSLLKVNRRFGGACCIHLQGRRINRARNQYEAGSKHRIVNCVEGSDRELF
jgi:hypothetical protein